MTPARLAIALGNPLAGADGFGAAVLAELRRLRPAGVELAEAGTDLLAWIDRLAAYDEVLLLDAVLDPARAGRVVVFEEEELLAWTDESPGAHQLSPLLAVQLYRALHGGGRPRFRLVGWCVARLRWGDAVPREAVQAGARAVLGRPG